MESNNGSNLMLAFLIECVNGFEGEANLECTAASIQCCYICGGINV